jgi:hypothetical protein
MSSFWSDATLEPKRKYRFQLIIGGKKNGFAPYTVTKVKNPAMKVSETPHKFLNHTFYYPGRAEWDPIDISFVDPSGPDDISQRLLQQIGKSGYKNPSTNTRAMSGFTKNAATSFGVGNVVIQQLGPANKNSTKLVAISRWELTNAFFTNISWGDFDYNGEDMLECSCTIRYDYADYYKGNTRVNV